MRNPTIGSLGSIGALLTNPVQGGIIDARGSGGSLAPRPPVLPRVPGLTGPPVYAVQPELAGRPFHPFHARGAWRALLPLLPAGPHLPRAPLLTLNPEIPVGALKARQKKSALLFFARKL